MGALTISDAQTRKLASAAAVVVLHLLVLALWLAPHRYGVHRKAEPRETILYLAPLPKPDEPKPIEQRTPMPRVRLPTLPQSRAITLPAIRDDENKALQGLGRALFDCRPENFATLTPEQQAACASASNARRPDGPVDFRDRSDRVAGAALWARQKARKNGPLLLPCANPSGISPLGTVLCLGDGIVNGFKPDNQAIYGDRGDEAHVPNNGDPHPEYADPDH